jgi:hypothetical protein
LFLTQSDDSSTFDTHPKTPEHSCGYEPDKNREQSFRQQLAEKVIADPTEPNMNMGNEAMTGSDIHPKLNVLKHLGFRQIISLISFPFVSVDCV